MSDLQKQLIKESRTFSSPDQSTYRGISKESIDRISKESDLALYKIEEEALNAGIIPLKYQRNIGTFGIQGQIAFLRATVAVIGAGGLGGHVIELLARTGTKEIIIIDNDRFEEENLNRQILCIKKNIKHLKAGAARDRVNLINPSLSVTHHASFLTAANAGVLLSGTNIVVDCVDHIPSRLIIQETASRLNIPMVSAAIGGFSGYVTTILPGDNGWKELIGSSHIPERGAEIFIGNPPTSPAFAASVEVQEVVKLLTGKGELLHNKLFFFDLESNTFEIIHLKE